MSSTSPQHYDPRMGDESEERLEDEEELHDQEHHHRLGNGHAQFRKHVRLHDGEAASAAKKEKSPERARTSWKSRFTGLGKTIVNNIPFDFQWIPNNWTWSKLKPVIRNAVNGWVSVLLVIIPKTERMLGQASFLIIIAAFLDPPSDPFIAVFEREILLLFCVCIAWAWSCLGIFLGNLARERFDFAAPLTIVVTGEFIEPAPTIIMAVFIFLGSTFFLYMKARLGPGPYIFVAVFSCICIDISLTTAVLFPYPFYMIGRAIVVPLGLHAALSMFFCATLFPSTMTARYMNAFGRVLDPLNTVLAKHREALKSDPSSEEFAATVSSIDTFVGKSEAGLAPAGASYRLLKRDIVWGRFAPTELGELEYWLRRLVTRSNGMGIYFTLIEPTREKFPVTPIPSVPGTPIDTPVGGNTPEPSRPPTPTGEDPPTLPRRRYVMPRSPLRQSISRHFSQHFHPQSHHHHHHSPATHDRQLHFSLLHLAHALSLSRVSPNVSSAETAVGVFESQRYLAFEHRRRAQAPSPEATAHFTSLLQESCDELLESCQSALKAVQGWVGGVRRGNWDGKQKIEKERQLRLEALEATRDSLKVVIERFRKEKRHRVLDPYRSAFDLRHVASPDSYEEPPPHRYLFHCYVYEYHLAQFATLLHSMLENITYLENKCKKARLWLPKLPLSRFLIWSRWDSSDDVEQNDDENPDVIQGIETELESDLGTTGRRDPDALPPQNIFQLLMYWIYRAGVGLSSGNTLFALKAGLLTIILSIPSFLKDTAAFAYGQRFVWGIFMGQLTLARWRGDTTFGLVARILATFFGSLTGMVVWYISTGNGTGSRYGLAATTGVAFPFFFFARSYWPGPPMTNVIFFVTTGLVIGYSWQNTHYPVGFHYWGWALAWRRFILVVSGVTAAFLFSFLPPSTTLRGYQRRMLATTVAELGSVYCSIVSFANTHRQQEVDKGSIIQSLIAIRLKLKRTLVLKAHIVYEFSLRGKWPAKRYQKILEIQLQIAFLLSHLMSVVEHLEPAWSRAFLRRTRFLDSDFQGDVLAVIALISTSLRTGHPLPQITPCPLLDRFMAYTHGLNVIRQEADDDYGLPRTMTIDTLENEQYMFFTVGVTTAFGIVMRLDRLMVATKELVGEQYHIHGVGLPPQRNFDQASVRPAKDV